MGLSFNDVLAMNQSHGGGVCSVATWRETLTDADRAQFDSADRDPTVQHSVLWRAMKSMGFERALSAVQRHRTRGCRCGL